MEPYSYIMAQTFFMKPSDTDKKLIYKHINAMNVLAKSGPFVKGIISTNYCPEDTNDIKAGERCFYTQENGKIIDTLRKYIDDSVEKHLRHYCLAPLLIKASINANTAGVFKGFYKNKETGRGTFGGDAGNALTRITKPISLDMPVWSHHEYEPHIYNENMNDLITTLPDDIDVMYIDPPYNQHPYSSNYFMLNMIITNTLPENISKVSGIPSDWTRSDYNYKEKAVASMKQLLEIGLQKSKFIILSYNNEGIIKPSEWDKLFEPYTVTKKEIKYDTYKGSRNLKNRGNKVIEIMYVVSR